jgi:hypothetical protein
MKLIKIVGFFLVCLVALSQTGCVYKFGGAEIFPATSEINSFKDSVEFYKIKYVSKDTYDLFWTNIYTKKGVFAINAHERNGKIEYSPLSTEYAESCKLKPKFSFWHRFGLILVIPIAIIIFFINSAGKSD